MRWLWETCYRALRNAFGCHGECFKRRSVSRDQSFQGVPAPSQALKYAYFPSRVQSPSGIRRRIRTRIWPAHLWQARDPRRLPGRAHRGAVAPPYRGRTSAMPPARRAPCAASGLAVKRGRAVCRHSEARHCRQYKGQPRPRMRLPQGHHVNSRSATCIVRPPPPPPRPRAAGIPREGGGQPCRRPGCLPPFGSGAAAGLPGAAWPAAHAAAAHAQAKYLLTMPPEGLPESFTRTDLLC